MSACHNLRTSSLFLLISFGVMAANASIQKIFKKDKQVPLLRFADIISTHYVDSEIDCSFRCLKEPTCVGFKYKHGVRSPSVNCQLSNSTGENDMADDDDQGWMFFVDITSKLGGKNTKALTTTKASTTEATTEATTTEATTEATTTEATTTEATTTEATTTEATTTEATTTEATTTEATTTEATTTEATTTEATTTEATTTEATTTEATTTEATTTEATTEATTTEATTTEATTTEATTTEATTTEATTTEATTEATTTTLPRHAGCSGYKWLNESNRNKKYSSSGTYCDRGLSTGWYRFGGGAGFKMLTSCVHWGWCGTDVPGWMNGTHPTVADGKVTRKVCYGWVASYCCSWSNNIEVVNCGQYYVYKLSKPPTCTLRYCGSDD